MDFQLLRSIYGKHLTALQRTRAKKYTAAMSVSKLQKRVYKL